MLLFLSPRCWRRRWTSCRRTSIEPSTPTESWTSLLLLVSFTYFIGLFCGFPGRLCSYVALGEQFSILITKLTFVWVVLINSFFFVHIIFGSFYYNLAHLLWNVFINLYQHCYSSPRSQAEQGHRQDYLGHPRHPENYQLDQQHPEQSRCHYWGADFHGEGCVMCFVWLCEFYLMTFSSVLFMHNMIMTLRNAFFRACNCIVCDDCILSLFCGLSFWF